MACPLSAGGFCVHKGRGGIDPQQRDRCLQRYGHLFPCAAVRLWEALRQGSSGYSGSGELLESCLGIIHPGDVVVLISQSGESVEIDRLTEKLRGTTKIIGITNQPDSTLARASSVLLLLHAGPEKSITNKTFTNTMALLYLLECCVAEGLPETLCGELDAAVPEMERVLRELPAEIAAAAKTLAPADMVHFIGRGGAAMTVANQSALIFMEGANCAARAFTSGGFHHGPIEICGPGHRAVFYANEPETFPKMLELARQIAGYGSHVVMVTNLPCRASRAASSCMPQPPNNLAMGVRHGDGTAAGADCGKSRAHRGGIPDHQ